MVTGAGPGARAELPGSLPLPVGQRLVVTALSSLLPPGFRARQRAEWAGDLLALKDGPSAVRRRYLLGAARTLPALRAAASRSRRADPSSLPVALSTGAAALTSLARVLLVGLGWPVVSWLLWVPGRYYLYDVPGRIAQTGGPVDPNGLLPDPPLFYLVLPAVLPLQLGALVALFGGTLMVMSIGLAAVGVGMAQRRRSSRHRLMLGLLGFAAILSVLGVMALGNSPSSGEPFGGLSDAAGTTGALGFGALGLGLLARSLTVRTRVALLLLAVGAAVLVGAHHTDLGNQWHTWFLD
jgi:hypothetical protein